MKEYAQKAEYFELGLVAGICEVDEVKKWAMNAVKELEKPCFELIDVVNSDSRDRLIDALRNIAGPRNKQVAGAMLLARIYDQFNQALYSPVVAVKTALKVAQIAELPERVYYDIDLIEDEMYLAKNNVFSNMDECANNLRSVLIEYGDFS